MSLSSVFAPTFSSFSTSDSLIIHVLKTSEKLFVFVFFGVFLQIKEGRCKKKTSLTPC